MVENQYAWLLSVLKSAYANKKTSIELRYYSRKLKYLLDILLSVGYISNYRFLDKQSLIIYLRYTNLQPAFKNMHIYFKSSSDETISITTLKRYLRHDRKTIFIISTSVGLITGLSAISSLNGGRLLCVLS